MTEPRGIVYRLLLGTAAPTKQYLTRCEELFTEHEWQWIPDFSRAYIFPTYSAAEQKAAELQPTTRDPLIPMVFREPYHEPEYAIPQPALRTPKS